MAPCPSCGAEAGPGSRFCEQCGASLNLTTETAPGAGTPPPPPPPGAAPPFPPASPQPPVPAGPPAAASTPLLPAKKGPAPALVIGICAALVIALAAGAYLFAPQILHWLPGTGALPGAATPAPTATMLHTTPTIPGVRTTAPSTPALTPQQTLEARYEETYEVIYDSARAYHYGEKVTFPHTLVRPPLYIKFTVTAPMVNKTKIDQNGNEVLAVYPDPLAWFEVRVRDATSGGVVQSQGFGVSKGYSVNEKQEFMVRNAGSYIIEMAGNKVDAAVQIRIGND